MKKVAKPLFVRRNQLVSETPNGDKRSRIAGVLFDLCTNPLDMDVKSFCISDVVQTPDSIEDLGTSEHPIRIVQEQLKQLEFAQRHLKPEGALIVKSFHGSGFSQIVKAFKGVFERVVERKPKASRDQSSETFLVGKGLKAKTPL